MPMINIEDAYILDETGAQVDQVTGLYFKNENASDTEKAQARANIGAGGSNDNLLDNAYFVGGGSQLGDGVFPINQRGQASYSGYGNHFDRWRGETNYASITLATDGVKFCSTTSGQWGTMVQYLAKECVIAGKTVTISAIIDGTLASTTYSIPASGGYDLTPATVGDISFNLYSPNGTDIQFRFYTTSTTAHTIAAAKLEEGTVSTLPNDLPHDFGEELRKCQRYLWVDTFGANTIISSGLAFNTSSVFDFVVPVPMRKVPIVATFTVTPYIVYGGNLALAGGATVTMSGQNGNHLRFQIGHQNNYDLGNLTEVHLLCGTDTTMVVSCEL